MPLQPPSTTGRPALYKSRVAKKAAHRDLYRRKLAPPLDQGWGGRREALYTLCTSRAGIDSTVLLLLFMSLSISPRIRVIRSEFLNMASSDRYMKLRLLPAPRYGRTREQSLIGPSLPSMKFFQAITILAENQSFRVAGGRKEGREVSRFFKAWSPSASPPSEFGPENQYLLLVCLSIRPFVRALFVAIS